MLPCYTKRAMVIIVDDDLDLVEFYRSEMAQLGLDAEIFSCPLALMKELESLLPRCTLLILDLHMPQMNGEQVLLHVKELHPTLAIAVLTGEALHFDDSKTLPLAQFFENVSIFEKPVPLAEVLKKYSLAA